MWKTNGDIMESEYKISGWWYTTDKTTFIGPGIDTGEGGFIV
jgi:hypothetical protein